MNLIKVRKDAERVKSILGMVELIEKRIKKDEKKDFFPLILSDYYEIIKELITALLICDGFRTLSHKELVEYLSKNYSEFGREEIYLIDKLRIFRNRSVYEGFKIPISYLISNEDLFKGIIKKLKLIIGKKLKKR